MHSEALQKDNPQGWFRNAKFDHTFIGGVALIALLSGVCVVLQPELFPVILITDLWLLGYHHVIATYTRLAFDHNSAREYRFFLFGLPVIVFSVTFLLAWSFGLWIIATIYLYWQWFHYTRQSWGISQAYRGRSGGLVTDNPLFAQLSFYLVPLWGILYRSWQAPEEFLFVELQVIPVTELIVDLAGLCAAVSVLLWGYSRFQAWKKGQLAVAHTYYMLSHYIIFLVGYRLIDDITFGWLVINVWHNAQYVLFVWLFNVNRYKQGIDKNAVFLSTISQPGNFLRYFFVCLALSTLTYGLISMIISHQTLILAGLPLAAVIYQTINFHHYIVDSRIWKVRKKNMQKTLQLKTR